MEQKEQVGIAINLSMALLMGVALGIVLIVIGAAVHSEGTYYAGIAITTLSLFGGGFLLKGENGYVRLGLLLAGGLILAYFSAMGSALANIRY